MRSAYRQSEGFSDAGVEDLPSALIMRSSTRTKVDRSLCLWPLVDYPLPGDRKTARFANSAGKDPDVKPTSGAPGKQIRRKDPDVKPTSGQPALARVNLDFLDFRLGHNYTAVYGP